MRNAKYCNWGDGKSQKWDYADEVEIPRFDTPEEAAEDYLSDMEKYGYCGRVEISGYVWDENFQAWEKSEDYYDFDANQEAYDREEERRIYGTE